MSAAGALVQTAAIPMTSAHVAYGATGRVSVHVGAHILSAIYKTVHVDPGVTIGAFRPSGGRPGLSVNLVLNTLWDRPRDQWSLYPELTLNAYWIWWRDALLYVGVTSAFDLHEHRPVHDVAPVWLPSLNLGHRLQLGRWGIITEARWLAPTLAHDGAHLATPIGLGQRGALGWYFGATARF